MTAGDTDQVDSVKMVLDDNANTVTRFEYMPYGETFVQKGNKDLAPKYNSQELDQETSFYFYNARHYSMCAKAHIRYASMDGRHPSMNRSAGCAKIRSGNHPICERGQCD